MRQRSRCTRRSRRRTRAIGIARPVSNGEAHAHGYTLSFDLPLREARDAFERMYFEHHLGREGG